MAKKKEVTFDDLVDSGIHQIIRSFGKGEDLRGAVWAIVNDAAYWGGEQAETRLKAEKKR